MNTETITFVISISALVFTAGGIIRSLILRVDRLEKDLKGIGSKVNREKEAAATRHHNISMAIMLAAPPEHEDKVSHLLKEGG